MSVRLPKKPAPAAPPRNEGTWLAMVFVVGVVGGILALISMVMPDVIGLLAVLGGFCGFVAIHYFTWGRWMMRSAGQSSEPESQPDRAELMDE